MARAKAKPHPNFKQMLPVNHSTSAVSEGSDILPQSFEIIRS